MTKVITKHVDGASSSPVHVDDAKDHIIIDSDEEVDSSSDDNESEIDGDLSDSESGDDVENDTDALGGQATQSSIPDSEASQHSKSNIHMAYLNPEITVVDTTSQQRHGSRFEVPEEISDDESEDADDLDYDPDLEIEVTQNLTEARPTPLDNPWLHASDAGLDTGRDECYDPMRGADRSFEAAISSQTTAYEPQLDITITKPDLTSSIQRPVDIWAEVNSNLDHISDKKEFFDAWAGNKETYQKESKAISIDDNSVLPVEREFSPTPFYGSQPLEEAQGSELDMTSAVMFNKSKNLSESSDLTAARATEPAIPSKVGLAVSQPIRSRVSINDIIDNIAVEASSCKKRKADQISDSVEAESQHLIHACETNSTGSDSQYQRPMKKLKSVAEIAGWVALGGLGLFSILVATAPDL